MDKKKILVVSGGISTEHEVSIRSGQMVYDNLDREKYEVEKAVIGKDGKWTFSTGEDGVDLDEAMKIVDVKNIDCVYIALHGKFGEDGQIQAKFEEIDQAYTGTDSQSSRKTMDKAVSNEVFIDTGLDVPDYQVLKSKSDKPDIERLGLPLVVKPNGGGSSVGTSIVKNESDLAGAIDSAFTTDDKVMLQKYISGREFTCGVLEQDGKNIALPPTEIIPISAGFFDYDAKYESGGSREVTPPEIESDKIAEMQEIAVKAHEALGCRGVTRTDFILAGEKFYVLEINTIPGMTETSLIPQEAAKASISNKQLLDFVIEASL